MPDQTFPFVTTAGDSGMMVMFGDSLDKAVNNATHAFDTSLRQKDWQGIEEVVPAIRGVLVRYDPLMISARLLKDKLLELVSSKDWLMSEPDPNRRIWTLPAHYGGENGPDLEDVADLLGKSVEQTVEEHSQATLTILMLGLGDWPKIMFPEAWSVSCFS